MFPWELHQEGGNMTEKNCRSMGCEGGRWPHNWDIVSNFLDFLFWRLPLQRLLKAFFGQNLFIKINTHWNYCTTCLLTNHYNGYNKTITFSITKNPLVSISQFQRWICFYHFFHLFHISDLNIISSYWKGWKLNVQSFLIPKKIETNLARNQNFQNCTIKPFWN